MIDAPRAKTTHWGSFIRCWATAILFFCFPPERCAANPQEIIAPYLSGVYDILRAEPDTPVMLLRLDGLGQFQRAQYDGFWSFLGIKKGRRHVSLDLRPITDLDPTQELAVFNETLEALLNS